MYNGTRGLVNSTVRHIKMNEWIAAKITELQSLKGEVIEKVMINDMAIIENGNGNHVFTHPECPFIQAQQLYLFLKGKGVSKILATDDGCIFLSTTNDTDLIKSNDANSIFRFYESTEFPLGKVDSLSIKQNKDLDINEVNIIINNKPVLLKSGEVFQNNDGSVSIKDDDESVLVFFNPTDVDDINFNA